MITGESGSVIFFAQVNIEVTNGHQRSILAECNYFSGNVPLSQNLLQVAGRRKKAFDSPFKALSLLCHQNLTNFNWLGYRGQ